jgi:hypothetical protein
VRTAGPTRDEFRERVSALHVGLSRPTYGRQLGTAEMGKATSENVHCTFLCEIQTCARVTVCVCVKARARPHARRTVRGGLRVWGAPSMVSWGNEGNARGGFLHESANTTYV